MLSVTGWAVLPLILFAWLTLLGVYDVTQTRHAILRNYPVLGHMRFLFEGIRPEIRQYLIESDQDEEPFSRDDRSHRLSARQGGRGQAALRHPAAGLRCGLCAG